MVDLNVLFKADNTWNISFVVDKRIIRLDDNDLVVDLGDGYFDKVHNLKKIR